MDKVCFQILYEISLELVRVKTKFSQIQLTDFNNKVLPPCIIKKFEIISFEVLQKSPYHSNCQEEFYSKDHSKVCSEVCSKNLLDIFEWIFTWKLQVSFKRNIFQQGKNLFFWKKLLFINNIVKNLSEISFKNSIESNFFRFSWPLKEIPSNFFRISC